MSLKIVTRNKDLRKLLAEAERQGCSVRLTTSRHVRVTRNGVSVSMSSTPSHKFALRKVQSDLRRYLGLNI